MEASPPSNVEQAAQDSILTEPRPFPIDTTPSSRSYALVKSEALALRSTCRESPSTIGTDSIGEVFANHMVEEVFPCWYGTPWEFEGYTHIPRQGAVACGYFVSTTLRDMGLKLNRYDMAKQWPIDEARTLALGGEVQSLTDISWEAWQDSLSSLPAGLFMLGLTNHVGFLLIQGQDWVFIHSDYVSGRVRAELVEHSEALKSSDQFHLVPISNNVLLMEAWLQGKAVPVVSQEKD